jgi:diaminohydroxyphosphoribosylaminopyrimidine deaminase/5-amino-6-(5-phosphoribosylamino)uracil reductase
MDRALQLAAQADHRTSPNPMVGAVVLDAAGSPVGEGFHERAGSAHAERIALAQAGPKATGGTLYSTLEPCNHVGRTPPCTEAMIAAGIRRVVVAMIDPDQRNRGRGVEALLEAGLGVEVGLAEPEASRLVEFYAMQRRTGRPFVTAKFAASLDGKIATREGESRWITGEEARAHAHRQRHTHDAVLVGVGTVLQDDPQLTARFAGARQPLRVVLDSKGRTPPGARVKDGQAETLFVENGRDLPALLDELGRRGILSLLVEGGAQVHGSFFAAGLVDRVCAYLAPMIIGGAGAPSPVGDPGVASLEQSVKLGEMRVTKLGKDVLVEADVHRDS